VLDISRNLPQIEYTPPDWERIYPESHPSDEERGEFEVDRSRVIHSSAFRRLQGKTQVFMRGSGDFYRTRLTHSLEAAQIAKGLALRLGANPDLLEAVSLTHDLGHPPFGHAGEAALNRCMQEHGGFEGNAQNLRLVSRLSIKALNYDGLNLSRATLDGVLKYKYPYSPNRQKFYYTEEQPLVEWACIGGSLTERSFDCQLMDWADEIAYSVHDFEDGIKSGMITSARLKAATAFIDDNLLKWALEQMHLIENQPSERSRKAARKQHTSHLIHEFITSSERLEINGADLPAGISNRYRYKLMIDPIQKARSKTLMEVMLHLMVQDERIATLENKAARIIEGLFSIFSNPEERTAYLFPNDFRDLWNEADNEGKLRIACDYIAGMTDEYAEKVYARLFLPNTGSIYNI